MISAVNLRDREVIDIKEGRKLGIVTDVEIDFEEGRIISIIIPGQGRFMGLFGGNDDITIPWSCIKKVGIDVILVDLNDDIKAEDEKE